MNYYEHATKVKIMDGIFEHSQDWDWFVEYTEEHFEINDKVKSFHDVICIFKDLYPVFDFLSHIRKFTNKVFVFKTDWLRDLDQLARFYVGELNVDTIHLTCEFSKVLLILVYAGKIYGQIKGCECYFYAEVFMVRNIFLLENIECFVDEEDTFFKMFDNTNVDFSVERNVFEDNINKVFITANGDFINAHLKDIYDANCFAFNIINDDNIRVWEERELLNMLCVLYDERGVIPLYSKGDKNNPDYTIWTERVLKHIDSYFNTESVTFLVESMNYALHKVQPSEATINKHFELLYKRSLDIDTKDSSEFSCSSLWFVIAFFNDDCQTLISQKSYKLYSQTLKKMVEKDCFYLLFKIKSKNAIKNKKIIKKLNDIIKAELDGIKNISSVSEFVSLIEKQNLHSDIETEHVSILSKKFYKILSGCDVQLIPTLFLDYFLFLLKIKNNRNIQSSYISREIIEIRKLWKHEFYCKSKLSLKKHEFGPISIPKALENTYVFSFLLYPYRSVSKIVKLCDDDMLERMIVIAENPLTMLVSRIIISEDFPKKPFFCVDEHHEIDKFYLNEIELQLQKKGYRLLNVFKPEKFASALYEQIENEIRIHMAFVSNVEPLYKVVVAQNPEYGFIEFSETPMLGHLTQLFPILENKIRYLGELLYIVPICESEDKCHRLKEPDGILKTIISYAYEHGDSLSVVADLFFVHFCMFGENGLNIRNDCVHGNGFNKPEEILLAFKITLLCLHIIDSRCQSILANDLGEEE